jgi:ABC-2 type transport system ATP-binding protein
MRRKLEIVRSLIHKPRVLFLDEPTVGLDPFSRRTLWEYLREMRHETGTTVLLTTHYLDEAEDSDTICIINKGVVVERGTPDGLKRALTREFLLLDADDRDALAAELRGLEVAFEPGPPLRVDVSGRAAQQLIAQIRTPLTLLRTHAPTLEDAYLAIIGRKAEDDGE